MKKHSAAGFFKLLTFLLIILPFCNAFSIGHAKTGAHTAANLQANASAALITLHISAGTLSPAFNAATTVYTESVTNGVSSITVTAKPADATDTMKVNGVAVAYGATSQAIALSTGANTITITVTTADGVTTQTYTVTVTRALPPNTNLIALHLSAGTLSPAFAQATTAYTESVSSGITSVTVTAKTADATATILVNGISVPYNTPSQSIALNPGVNNISVIVVNSSITKSYTITVTRAAGNDNLATLHLSAGTLSPGFAQATTTYTESVTNAISSVTVTAKTADAAATMKVNGTTVAYGATSQSIVLNPGVNIINIAVTAADGISTKTYSVTVTRAGGNANLATLHLSAGTLSPAFSPDTTAYTESVTNAVTAVGVYARANDAKATVRVNGAVLSPIPTAYVPAILNVGTNTIILNVIAADGLTTKTYTVTVTRAALINLNLSLSALGLSKGTFNPPFNPADTVYSATVSNSVTSIAITPKTADNKATVKVIAPPPTFTYHATSAFQLANGVNTFSIVVTAPDGNSSKTYKLNITKALPTADSPDIYSFASDEISKMSNGKILDIGFEKPTAMARDKAGNIYIITLYDNTIWKIDAKTLVISDIAGSQGYAGDGGSAYYSSFNFTSKSCMAVDSAGNIYISDSGNNVIRKIDAVTNIITTIIGTPAKGGSTGGGPVIEPSMVNPTGIAFASGYLYFEESLPGNPTPFIKKLQVGTTNVTTVAGNGQNATLADSAAATSSSLNVYTGPIAVDKAGNLYISEYYPAIIRKVSNGVITRITGNNNEYPYVPSVSGLPAKSSVFGSTGGVACDDAGNIFFTDPNWGEVRKIDAQTGIQTLYAGKGILDYTGDYGPATDAELGDVLGLLFDSQGNLLVADNKYNVIRKIGGITPTSLYAQPQMPYNIFTPNAISGDPMVSTALTPNGDGRNDVLTIDNIQNYPNNKLQVMDSNGKLVYAATGYDNSTKAFDGHSSVTGKLQQPGTYYYSLDYMANGQLKHVTGYIVLKY